MKNIGYNIIIAVLLIVIVILTVKIHSELIRQKGNTTINSFQRAQQLTWTAPDTTDIPLTKKGELIRYGRELIVHTARYFGPKGSLSKAENGLNCQDCHIAAGTRLFGNDFAAVASAYPRYTSRTDRYISIADRINGCMQRSMSGKAIDSLSREMKAFIAYFKWIGNGMNKRTNSFGTGTGKLTFLDRAADPQVGKIIFMNNCAACHGEDGGGKLNADSIGFLYPPLWGSHSYNMGAGLYRISKLASFIKNNMPFGTTYHHPVLSDDQAWDVAAFVDSQPRPPFKEIKKDWPDIIDKPFDDPFGPYADSFSKKQHKYGPFLGIINNKQKIHNITFQQRR